MTSTRNFLLKFSGVVTVPLGGFPRMPFTKGESGKIAKGQRAVSSAELKADPKCWLKNVVLRRDLVNLIEGNLEKYISDNNVDFDRRANNEKFLSFILDPSCTSLSGLPPITFSENDTRDWFRNLFGNPATCLLNAVDRFIRTKTGTENVIAQNQIPLAKPIEQNYHLVSASGKDYEVVPDLLLVEKDLDNLNEDELVYDIYKDATRCVIELKTANSYDNDTFKGILESGIPDNCAIPFVWPARKKHSKKRSSLHSQNQKASRMILQVYYQMVDRDVQYGVLTNYQQIIFFFRPKKLDNTIVMSKEYEIPQLTPDNTKKSTLTDNEPNSLRTENNDGPTILKLASWFAQACEEFYKPKSNPEISGLKVNLDDKLELNQIDESFTKDFFNGSKDMKVEKNWGIHTEGAVTYYQKAITKNDDAQRSTVTKPAKSSASVSSKRESSAIASSTSKGKAPELRSPESSTSSRSVGIKPPQRQTQVPPKSTATRDVPAQESSVGETSTRTQPVNTSSVGGPSRPSAEPSPRVIGTRSSTSVTAVTTSRTNTGDRARSPATSSNPNRTVADIATSGTRGSIGHPGTGSSSPSTTNTDESHSGMSSSRSQSRRPLVTQVDGAAAGPPSRKPSVSHEAPKLKARSGDQTKSDKDTAII